MSSNTEVIHIKDSGDYPDDEVVYIGRGSTGGKVSELKHLNNTGVGERGWLGNPYVLESHSRSESIELFKGDFKQRLRSDEEFCEAVKGLQGCKLACYCKPKSCHGEVVKEAVEALNSDNNTFL